MGYNVGGIFFNFLLAVVIVVGIIYVIKANNKNQDIKKDEKSSALNILNEMYAKGEINEDEYKKRKENIMN